MAILHSELKIICFEQIFDLLQKLCVLLISQSSKSRKFNIHLMEAKSKGKLTKLQPKISQFHQQTLFDVIKKIKFRIDNLRSINLDPQALVLAAHHVNDLLDTFIVFWKVNSDLVQ